jgi:uncharacterized protein YcgI (DUF1989 family)
VTFFKGIGLEEDGTFTWRGSAGAGTRVDLVAELPLLILIANVAHPLDPRPTYEVGPLRIHAWRGVPTRPADAQFTRSPELERAYLNTADYAEARGC